eukprot:1421549-Amphidinium_carterae.1
MPVGLPPMIYMAMDKLMSLLTKVYHHCRLVGPQLWERPEDEPRARLLAEPVEEEPALLPGGMVFPETPFQLGQQL